MLLVVQPPFFATPISFSSKVASFLKAKEISFIEEHRMGHLNSKVDQPLLNLIVPTEIFTTYFLEFKDFLGRF